MKYVNSITHARQKEEKKQTILTSKMVQVSLTNSCKRLNFSRNLDGNLPKQFLTWVFFQLQGNYNLKKCRISRLSATQGYSMLKVMQRRGKTKRLTWIRSFLESATKMLPSKSTATPLGRMNIPSADPWKKGQTHPETWFPRSKMWK